MRKTITGIILTLLLASMSATVIHVMPAATMATTEATSVMVNVLIDYGNGTKTWYLGVVLPSSATVFNATEVIATVNYTDWGPWGIFVDAINGVWNSYPYYWIWWYWNYSATPPRWMLGPVASNFYTLNNGDSVAWYYEDCSEWPPLPPEDNPPTMDVKPDTLNLESQGSWVTCYIELPMDYEVSNIDISTILLNDTIPVDLTGPTEIGDYDEDGISDLMVKFDRSMLQEYMLSQGIRYGIVTLTIFGMLELDSDTPFIGNDIIEVRTSS